MNDKEIYLDNSATTQVDPAVIAEMTEAFGTAYGNPSSLHKKGVEAERLLRRADERIGTILKCRPKELIYTSGGTESNNLAVFGAAAAHHRRGKHLVTTKIEHPSVLNAMRQLEKEGFDVTYLGVDREGRISLNELASAIRPETILVSVMMVNNEIGTREPVEEAGALIKEKNPETLFHVDAVQGFGKYRIVPKKCGIDLLSVSAHKIHGPKGCGFLYVREGVRIRPLLYGGGQQRDLRSGTENVPGIAGTGAAAALAYEQFDEKTERLYALRERLSAGLSALPDVTVNGPQGRDGAPHIVSASFAGVRSEVLLHALEERGICCSSGSACASNHPGLSETLLAAGLPRAQIESTLRFSLSGYNTEEEIDACVSAAAELLPVLRRFTRK